MALNNKPADAAAMVAAAAIAAPQTRPSFGISDRAAAARSRARHNYVSLSGDGGLSALAEGGIKGRQRAREGHQRGKDGNCREGL